MLEELENEERQICATVTIALCKLADKYGFGREYFCKRLLEEMQDFVGEHDLSKMSFD